jgi:hypothetical protein
MAVANDGGAVGFAFPPVDVNDVEPVADRLIADLDPDTTGSCSPDSTASLPDGRT